MDGYSLYQLAQFTASGLGGLSANTTRALELYDQLIQGADNDWYPYEERYPALLSKYALIIKVSFNRVKERVSGWWI